MTIGTGWSVRAVLLAATVTVAGLGGAAWAQTAPEKGASEQVNVPANALSVGEIESRLSAQGIRKPRPWAATLKNFTANVRYSITGRGTFELSRTSISTISPYLTLC